MQIPWNDNNELLVAWRDARTGYPWIDAVMIQVRSVVFFLHRNIDTNLDAAFLSN